ncbi:MAG TPA: DUF2252 family protein [Polyangiaceae bacterium]|jgi:uncharacterized protein (DUF2252 family)
MPNLGDVTHGPWRALAERREAKMAESVHAFLRGNTAAFYDWLSGRRLPKGPPIWIGGDLHVGNIGPVAAADEEVALQIRDLDQTVIGNPTHDVLRLGFSLATVALASGLDGTVMLDMLGAIAHGYAHGVARRRGGERPKPVRFVMKKAHRRSWPDLLDERDVEHASLPRSRKFMRLTRGARAAIERIVEKDHTGELVTMLGCRDDDATVRLLDAAFWVKGCSSLGLVRIAALVAVSGSSKKKGGLALLDFKEARPSCAPTTRHPAQAEAERVVLGARALAPNLGERMLATHVLGRSVFVRELLPQDLKLELEDIARSEAANVAAYVARVVGLAHGHQMDEPTRREWLRALQSKKSATFPAWLGAEVSRLLALQARAYLEHCATIRGTHLARR